ncbi:MAG: uracil-DNA glycosylase [Candidatus Actinomarina sp.]
MTTNQDLLLLHKECRKCKSCELSKTRNNVVVAKGNSKAKILIIGEGPGEQEDITGFPFVGRAGKMLDSALMSVEIDPLEDCYITNIVKCRPPQNRKPLSNEINSCMPWLKKQINLLSPKIIILAGSTSVEAFLEIKKPISKIRGEWIIKDNVKIMPIFHPSYLLRSPFKRAWETKMVNLARFKKS